MSQSPRAQQSSAQQHITKYQALKSTRANWDSHWQEVSYLVHPNFDDVYGQFAKGEKKGRFVFDNTPTHANSLLASALHGMLTNPATYWFGLKTGDPDLDQNDVVRKWLQGAAFRINDVLTSSNFQTEIIEVFMGLGSIGTWVLFMDEDDEKVVNFNARAIYQSYIAENKRGEVDIIYRTEKWTKPQIMEKWGNQSKATESKDDWRGKLERRSDTEELEILHCVYPRSDYDNKGLPSKFKYGSEWILLKEALTISQSGFREFPYAIPRWSKVSGEIYGRSPAMNCLADIKMLQAVMKVTIKGLEKTVDPPILAPDEGIVLPLKLISGGINYYRAGSSDQIKPLQTDARVDFGQKALEDIRGRILKAFYIDQLQLQEGPQMTATEVQRRTEQQLRLMGPILGRLHHELIKPIVDRVFAIMLRKGLLPDPIPPVLSKKKLQIQYSSLIAKAQRASEADDITRALNVMAPLFQLDPASADWINEDMAVKKIAKIFDLSEDMITDESDVNTKRQQKAQAQQQQAQMMQQQHSAQVTKDAGPVVLDAAKMAQENESGTQG